MESALADIAEKLDGYGDDLQTEEATKNALIMPFISRVLGYDVFNPGEVIPEFVADVGSRKSEKVDYAIMHDGHVQMLIEAKQAGAPLSLENATQLTRYFTVVSARIGVLTNGRHWLFYTDLDKPNIMDAKPFLRLDIADVDNYTLPELRKLTKESFDLDSILAAAEELKYVSAAKAEVAREFSTPSPELIRLFAKRIYDGSITAKVQATFEGILTKAMRQFITEQVNGRLKTALDGDQHSSQPETMVEAEPAPQSKIVTTEEEKEAFLIVRAILASEVPLERVAARDRQSYFGVLLDDNNRKPICRLYLDSPTIKRIGIFGPGKIETKHQIFNLNDIYGHADDLRTAVHCYD